MIIADELNELFILARNMGVRFDLIQAGGGNISLKAITGQLYVKASGINLSEMKNIENCAQVHLSQLKQIIDSVNIVTLKDKKQIESFGSVALNESNLTKTIKPSIETFFHVYGYKYTLHTHPVLVNAIMITKSASKTIQKLIPNALCIDYYTPGVELAIAIKNELENYHLEYGMYPPFVFLKNHGVIVSADTINEVITYYDNLSEILSNYFGLNFQAYMDVTKIMSVYNVTYKTNKVAYYSSDVEITNILNESLNLFKIKATYPDQYVFNGIIPCFSNTLADLTVNLLNYCKTYNEVAKVIILKKNKAVYFMADNLKRARDMEDVFKFHLLSLKYAIGEIDSLNMEEFKYLSSWDAEKYRQKL